MLICRTITTKATEISPTDASARRIRGRLPSFKRAVSLLWLWCTLGACISNPDLHWANMRTEGTWLRKQRSPRRARRHQRKQPRRHRGKRSKVQDRWAYNAGAQDEQQGPTLVHRRRVRAFLKRRNWMTQPSGNLADGSMLASLPTVAGFFSGLPMLKW